MNGVICVSCLFHTSPSHGILYSIATREILNQREIANMETLSHTVRVSIPNYLRALPVPETIGGFFRLSFKDWIALTPIGLLIAGSGWWTYRTLTTQSDGLRSKAEKKNKVNETIKKDCPKVVDTVDIEEIGDKKVFCRCWRSKKFPYCDGAHTQHNEETGDNVGPLIIKK